MTDFFLHVPSRVLFGIDTINRLSSFVIKTGDRALIVTEAILYENGTINRVQKFLDDKGINYITFDEVVPNATSTCLENGVKLARVSKINTVIGLGGIRSLSIAKSIAMAATSSHPVDEYLSGLKPAQPALPYLEIPTTCRNPFMLTDNFLITDARDRRAFIGTCQPEITKYIIFDPQLAVSLPEKYLATTLLDIFLHAIEGYLSKKSNFLSDSFFLKAIELISILLLQLNNREEELLFLNQAATAGFLTALGHTMCQPGLGAALAYAMNARHLIPKSWTAVIILPHILAYNQNVCAAKMATIARLLGEEIQEATEAEVAEKAILAVQRIISPFNLPSRFGEFDLKLDDMIEVAENAFSFELIQHLPRGVTTNDIYNLIKDAF